MNARYEYDSDGDALHVMDVTSFLAGRDVIPLRVAVCLGCGSVVADQGIHDRVCILPGVYPENGETPTE